MRTDKIYLVGFMGAGKSTVARALGRRLAWRVEDIDEAIEARERASVADLFAQRGELYFRLAEREVLRGLLHERQAVVATGGGTFADPDNRADILGDGAAIWLDIPFAVALERVPPDGRRPLAGDRATFEALFRLRTQAYRLAHLRLDASRAPVQELVERILDWLGY
ncbi:MAG TPA: shikimate kinase [Vicinamibacterales bacterium]|nr:shikimate kinase [Vicinamibacterales bacterium]